MKRKDPASVVVEYFESAPLETAQTVLAIAKGVVARRQPAKSKLREAKAPKPPRQAAAGE